MQFDTAVRQSQDGTGWQLLGSPRHIAGPGPVRIQQYSVWIWQRRPLVPQAKQGAGAISCVCHRPP